MSGAGLRILQASDLHLGGRAWPGCFSLTPEQARTRQLELRKSLDRLGELASLHKPDVLLLAGDLFDSESASTDLVNHAVDVLGGISCPIFLSPGNHDSLGESGPYALLGRPARGLRPWPSHVHLFTSSEFTTVCPPALAGVSVTGHAFMGNVPRADQPLAKKIERPQADISLLVLHGSRLSFALEELQKITLPFTAEQLLAQGFSYAALGHYHAYSEIRDGQGRLRAAYGGCPFAAELPRGDSPSGCILTTVTADGAEKAEVFPLDGRRIVLCDIRAELVGSPEELRQLAKAAFDGGGGTPGDFAVLRFSGTHAPGWTPSVNAEFCFAASVSLRGLRPGFDLAALRAESAQDGASLESRFAAALLDELERTDDPAARQVLQDALDYGLCALTGVAVEAKDAD